ncbi:right-handed parallel beta-helix repeat-containing protein, partial [Methanobrevibacter filiformis]|uniref:NosD domain-containing protein n=1 Tax=Methanobrevibacter filiformis TaxID=55758 RepID=UPI000AAF895B
INGKGKSNTFESNILYSNSKKGKYCAVYFKGDYNKYYKNSIYNNGYHGLHVVGKINKIEKNNLYNNKYANSLINGNYNNILENTIHGSKTSGIILTENNNKITLNKLWNNKQYNIRIKGNSNHANNNTLKSSNLAIHIIGSKNKFIQNTIHKNTKGIYLKQGKNNYLNYNYIINKNYNLKRKSGSINAEYNWWGINKINKVHNTKVSKYVIAKLKLPNVKYLKPNKPYKITLILLDNNKKKLKKIIPSTASQFGFYKQYKKTITIKKKDPKTKKVKKIKTTKLAWKSLKISSK